MFTTVSRLSLCGFFLAMLIAFSCSAKAAGFYIQEQSVSGLGAAYAGQVAMPRDSSIIYYNPAGMTYLDGRQFNIGLHMISPTLEMDDAGTALNNPGVAFSFAPGAGPIGMSDGGNPNKVTAIPNFYIAAPLTDDEKLWAGFGVSAPFGMGSEYEDDFFARFDATETKLKTIDAQPALAYQPADWFSVGASLIIQYAKAELDNIAAVPVANGAPPPAFFVVERPSKLAGDDISYGANIGVMIKPWESTTIGANFRSRVEHVLDGTIEIGGVFFDTAKADLDLPEIATLGVSHKVNDRWTALFQASWYGWDSFDQIAPIRDSGAVTPPIVQNYQNTWAFAAGAEYQLNDDWVIRAGYQFDESPATDEYRTTRTPDGDRHWFSAGATYELNDKLSFDIGGTYIDVKEEPINLQRGAGANVVTVSAHTDNAWVGIVSFGLNYKF